MIVRRESYHRVPWANGGGVADDILVEGTPVRRRLSLATIARDGPFSDFSGYDRVFVLVAGSVALLPGGSEPIALDDVGALWSFRGEQPVACAPRNGEAQAFNVMTLRSTDRAAVTVRAITAGEALDAPAGAQWAFVGAGALSSEAGSIRRFDTLDLAAAASPIAATEDSVVVYVAFSDAPASG